MNYTSEKIGHLKNGGIEKTTYDNGAVFLHHTTPHLNGSSLCVWFKVGSKDESMQNEGICHLLEHMIFREGLKSPKKTFLNKIEECGADVNAFTTKETICFELSALGKRIPEIFDNFMDLILSPTFEDEELEKEKNVVIQEIREDEDDYEILAEEKMFEKSFSFALGHSIAGSRKIVKALTSSDLKSFYSKYFVPSRMVITLVGDMPSTTYKKKLDVMFQKYGLGGSHKPIRFKLNKNFGKIDLFHSNLKRSAEVSNFIISGIGTCIGSPYRVDLVLLNSYLSAGMSSLLFRALREDEGLVYSLSSYPNTFSDNGNLIISTSTQRSNLAKVHKKIEDIFEYIAENGIAANDLAKTKRQLLDSWELSLDDVEDVNSFLSKSELFKGGIVSEKDIIDSVERISSKRISYLAGKILDHGFSTVKILAK